jgi:hypothetical protein
MGQIDAPKRVQVRKSARRRPVQEKGGLASRDSTAVAQLLPKKDAGTNDIPPSVWPPPVQLDDDLPFTHTTHRTQLAEVMEASLLCEHSLHLLMANDHHAPLAPSITPVSCHFRPSGFWLPEVCTQQPSHSVWRDWTAPLHRVRVSQAESRVHPYACAHWWWVGG